MGKDIKELEGLEIFLGYACNVKCDFCYQKDLRLEYKKNIPMDEVISLLKDGYDNGKRFIIFSGGEPTIDKNLGFYIEYSKQIGFKHIRVHTNGFRFQSYKYLEDLYDKGLTGITLSIHGYKEVQDTITNVKGSFDIIQKALINFQKLKNRDNKFIFDLNTVICKDNVGKLLILFKYLFINKFNFTRSQIVSAYSLDLFTTQEKKSIIPEYKTFITEIEKILILSYHFRRKVVIENIPFCMITKNLWGHISDNIKIDKSSITLKEYYKGNLDQHWMKKIDQCKSCDLYAICRGIPKDYLEVYNNIQLSPIKGIKQ